MKKIMFNDRFGLTKAVLEGRKTQTRRVMGVQGSSILKREMEMMTSENYPKDKISRFITLLVRIASPYKEGDIVAIAQSYKDCCIFNDKEHMKLSSGWSNKMFVRADLMPHHIKIERIRVERLQEISDEDCKREGIVEAYRGCYWLDGFYHTGTLPQIVYRELIDKISGKETWSKNPFVFVYDFKLID